MAQVDQDLQAALEQLVELAGRDLNFNSPKQVLALLGDLGLEVSSTAEAALAPFAADQAVVGALLKYRKLKKLQGLYGPTFASHVNRVTERIHADYRQLGSVARRMSCTHPNVRQVPHEANYRSLFVAPPGRKLLKADYSQIELRIGAEISGDKALLQAYADGLDLHQLTASRLLSSNGHVSKDQRQAAKAINFGFM